MASRNETEEIVIAPIIAPPADSWWTRDHHDRAAWYRRAALEAVRMVAAETRRSPRRGRPPRLEAVA